MAESRCLSAVFVFVYTADNEFCARQLINNAHKQE